MTTHPPSQDDMPQPVRPTDDRALEDSVLALLQAAGMDPEHPQLRDTPQRVRECWSNDLLDGYRTDPATILADRYPARDGGLVVVRDIDCHGMCPHHLLPFVGKVHLAYLPRKTIVGFSRLGELVRCLTHRLTLQETATHDIASALMTHLNARGAGCVMQAQQLCMCLRSNDQRNATVLTQTFLGELRERPPLQQHLL